MKTLQTIIQEKLKINSKSKITDSIDYVDMGLSSGILWAKCNYEVEKETDFGEYLTYHDTEKLNLPTEKDVEELKDNCEYNNTSINGVKGIKLTSKINGNYIFLPLGGFIIDKDVEEKGSKGYYWVKSTKTPNDYAPIIVSSTFGNIWLDSAQIDQKFLVRTIKNSK